MKVNTKILMGKKHRKMVRETFKTKNQKLF